MHRGGKVNMSLISLARIPDRFSQHGVKLALGELLRLPCLLACARHLLIHRAAQAANNAGLGFGTDTYLGFCCWRLVTALQAQTS